MTLSVAIQMDPIERLRVAGDTGFALMLEAQARGHTLFTYTPDKLSMRDGKVTAPIRPVTVRDTRFALLREIERLRGADQVRLRGARREHRPHLVLLAVEPRDEQHLHGAAAHLGTTLHADGLQHRGLPGAVRSDEHVERGVEPVPARLADLDEADPSVVLAAGAFDQASRQRAVSMLESHLAAGGHLVVAHTERLTGLDHGLRPAGPSIYWKPA